MASFVGLYDQLYVGQLDLTANSKTINFGPLQRAMKDSTSHADGGYACVIPGLISGQASMSGIQDWTADVFDDDLSIDQLGTQYPVTVIPNPTGTVTAGDICWISRGVLSAVSPMGTAMVGEIAGAELTLPYDTAIPRSYVAHPKAARTTTGTGTAVAVTGPSSTQKLYAALHVTAYSGLTNVVFKVQSDNASNFPSATDRITFTTVTGRTSEWSSVAGDFSTETHLRASWTVTGTGSVTFVMAFGVI